MMYMHISKSAVLKLQWLCKDFLWGFAKNGHQKIPLISWECIALPHQQGGLDIQLSYFQGTALLTRWASNLISTPSSEWSCLFLPILSSLEWHFSHTLKCNGYSLKDKLVFGRSLSFRGCKYTTSLWQAWEHLHCLLQLWFPNSLIHAQWSIQDALLLTSRYNGCPLPQHHQLIASFCRLGVQHIQDLWDHSTNRWKDFSYWISYFRNLSPNILQELQTILFIFHSTQGLTCHE